MNLDAFIQRVITFIKELDISKLSGVAALIFLVGLIILGITFIIPVLAVVAALGLIVLAIYFVYKAIGGR